MKEKELTFEAMIERQRVADAASEGYRQKAQQEKDKADQLQEQLDDALRDGDKDRFSGLIAVIDEANAAAVRYQKLADATDRKLYTLDECRNAWNNKRLAFFADREYTKEKTAFDAALESVVIHYSKMAKMIDGLKESAVPARDVIVCGSDFNFGYETGSDKAALLTQIQKTINRCKASERM